MNLVHGKNVNYVEGRIWSLLPFNWLNSSHDEKFNRGVGLMSGWSALGGQAQSAYTSGNVDLQDTPLGHTVGIKHQNDEAQCTYNF